MSHGLWPAVNAVLNGTSAVLLTAGFLAIRTRRIALHTRCMAAAAAVSAVFFVSYLLYHAQIGSVKFQGQGASRPLYFTVLLSHTILAVVIAPLVLRTLFLAWRQRFSEHRAIARFALPLWLYVSVSGVAVYGMLYHWHP